MSDLSWWFSRLESMSTEHLAPTLERVRSVALRMGLLPVPYRVISVTGTNGKGSTTTACEHILTAHGYRVAAFTSPHLLRFNERIRLDAQEIPDADLIQAFEAVQQAQQDIPLNYFQYAFLAALWWFAHHPIEVAVLEIGIGGLLDCVNIIDADVAVITNIGLDHQATLGETHEAIGLQKAGIMRPNRPVVFGDTAIPASITRYAQQITADLMQVKKDYDYEVSGYTWSWTSKKHHYPFLPIPTIALSNAALALMALQLLDIPLEREKIAQGLKAIHIPARIQVIQKHCEVIIDASHNVESMLHLARYLHAHPVAGKTQVVFSCLSDKNIPGMMAALPDVQWHMAPLKCARAASVQELTAAAQKNEASYEVYDDILSAYEHAMQSAQPHDRVIVCGSFYTVATIMRRWQ